MFKTFFPLVLLLLASFQPALSHDAWLQQKDGSLLVMFGHGKSDPYDPEQVKDAKAFDCKGTPVPVEMAKLKDSVTLLSKGNPAIVTVLFDGCVVKTTEGYKKVTKREAQGKYTIVEALKYRKYSKALLAGCDTFSRPVGLPLEVVPEKDPFAVKSGEALPIRVLMEGRPLEGAAVRNGDVSVEKSKTLPVTDKDGMASIPIENSGLQIIHAQYKSALKDDPDADALSLCSSLTFEVK